jgi:RHS repeat-associated protein
MENRVNNLITANERGFENRYIQFGARTYDPEIGRFMSVDPMFELYPDLTPYNYCNNSPLIHSDPTGMYTVTLLDVDNDGNV